jgi:hypothetical protein
MASEPTFRDQAEQFRQLARVSADPEVHRAALDVADKLDALADAVEQAARRGATIDRRGIESD